MIAAVGDAFVGIMFSVHFRPYEPIIFSINITASLSGRLVSAFEIHPSLGV